MFEGLLLEAESEGIEVINHSFKNLNLKGLYVDGVIILNPAAIHTTAEKNCILAEEIGHHHSSFGNILDQKNIVKRKQEYYGKKWAYQKLVPLTSFVSAFNAGVRNRFEFAEHLGITERFLDNAISYYIEKHGLYHSFDGKHLIYFDPLGVALMFED
ncbi:ImmA/IrrE family metallo-endopeptidase [Paenibacillus sp. FSL R5-0475]|uniref:ImmA/IrrE family metallo-endopeptidase n=1 Tax=Paenibacillus sp. FSL R5-0475 TaxID=2921643 RepID=UPI0030FC64A6